jgi:CheY-like chemotaxis protein
VDVGDDPLDADCDVVRITQVFSNLLHNAAKYTPAGGSIWVIGRRIGDVAIVKVRDTGVGIQADKLPRLFEMFYQADSSPERAEGGLGIGLTLVHRLLEMHGGDVEAHSDGPGRGSEFTVRLPLSSATIVPFPEPRAEPKPAIASSGPLRILVVDDNRDSAEMLRALLQLVGNDVQTAFDGEEALRVADTMRPDAILLDIGLPRMNGYDVCRALRQRSWGRDLLIVAQTGWGQDQDLRRSQDAGFDAHFTKPVDDEALLKLLDEWRPGRGRPGGARASFTS